jgi:8-hydroxy-5-deazaflavin:NADPH oxidoreductase
MKIAILGTGAVAHALGGGWRNAGHEVLLGARDPSASDPLFKTTSLQEAAATGDVVVNAITGAQALKAVTALDWSGSSQKILLDVANAVTERFELLYPNSSLAERLQEALPDTRVVKSLNTAAIQVLAEPSLVAPSSVFLSGDDDAAKDVVRGLLHDLGWTDEGIIDLGGIDTARGPEAHILLFAGLVGALKSPLFNIRVTR